MASQVKKYVAVKALEAVHRATEQQSEIMKADAQKLMDEGHSKACANTHVASVNGMLDGDESRVLALAGGCPKCDKQK